MNTKKIVVIILTASVVVTIGTILYANSLFIQPKVNTENIQYIKPISDNHERKVSVQQNNDLGTMWNDEYTNKTCSLYNFEMTKCITDDDILGTIHYSALKITTSQIIYKGIIKELDFTYPKSTIIFTTGKSFPITSTSQVKQLEPNQVVYITKTINKPEECKIAYVTSLSGKEIQINKKIDYSKGEQYLLIFGLGDPNIPLEMRFVVASSDPNHAFGIVSYKSELGNCTKSEKFDLTNSGVNT